jgi:hypothetical protein
MSKRTLGLVAGLVVVLAGGLWWWLGRTKTAEKSPATITAKPNSGGATGARPDDGPASGVDAIVRGVDGKVVDGAVVRVAPASGADVPEDLAPRTTGADGRASFDVPPGRYRVTAAATGRAPAESAVEVAVGARAPAELTLSAAAPLVGGTVSDAGGPVAGAVVTIAPQPGVLSADTPRAIAAFTDASGAFSTSVLPGRYQVTTHHPEYLADTRALDVGPDGATLAIQLSPGAVIEGRVVDRASGPVAGARVTWARELAGGGPLLGRSARGGVTAGPDGAFRITGLGAGRIELEAMADDGRASRGPVEVELGIAETLVDVELAVAAAPTIAGVVLREDKKTPVPGAIVMMEDGMGARGVGADDQGRFRIPGVAPGKHRLFARAEDALEGPAVEVAVTAGAPVPDVTLVVKAGAFIVGRVEPPGPAEISEEMPPDADLMGGGMMRFTTGTRARTELDGTFKVGPFPDGEVHLKARAADGRQGKAIVTVPATGQVVIALEERGSIAGRVVDAAGAPLPGVVVSMRHRAKGGQRMMVVNGVDVGADRAPVDNKGAFALAGRDPGDWELVVIDARGTTLPFAKAKEPDQPIRVALAPGEKKTGVVLAVDAPTGSIRGVVVDTSGKAVPDAWVSVSRSDGWLPGLPPGVGGPGPGPRRGPHDAGGAPPGEEDGGMVMVAQVIDDTGSGGMAGDVPPVLTGADGTFTVSGLRKGSYNVTAEGLKGGARGMTPDVKVASGPVDTTVKVVALGRIEGVVRMNGAPVTDFTVMAENGRAIKRRELHADDGAYRLSSLDPGNYTVTAKSDAGTGSIEVVVVAGQTAQGAIDMVMDAHVSGVFVDANGAPLADRMVLVMPRQAPGEMSIQIDGMPPRTGADGRFTVASPAGARTLLVMGPKGPELKKDIDVKTGEQLDLGTLKAEPMGFGFGGPPPGPPPGPTPRGGGDQKSQKSGRSATTSG